MVTDPYSFVGNGGDGGRGGERTAEECGGEGEEEDDEKREGEEERERERGRFRVSAVPGSVSPFYLRVLISLLHLVTNIYRRGL